jgi:hypothetical protein
MSDPIIPPADFSLGLLNVHGDLSLIAKALPKAQMALGTVTKDKNAKVKMKSGGEYSYAYSDLSNVLEAVLPAFNGAGIAILQPPSQIISPGNRDTIGKVQVTTLLVHESGAVLWGDMEMTPGDTTPQAIGSAITYARRYAILAFCGVAPEDDDGARASQRPAREEYDQRPAQRAAQEPRPAAQTTEHAPGQPSIDEVRAHMNRAMLELQMKPDSESTKIMIAHVTRERAETMPVATAVEQLSYDESREAMRLLRGKIKQRDAAAAAPKDAMAAQPADGAGEVNGAEPAAAAPAAAPTAEVDPNAVKNAPDVATAMSELAKVSESASDFCTACGGKRGPGGELIHLWTPLGEPCHEDKSAMAEQFREMEGAK